MSKKRVGTGQEGFSPVGDNNTPEKEISCVLNSPVDVGVSKFCGVSESCSEQKGSNSVENGSVEKEICVVSGGVVQFDISTGPCREVDESLEFSRIDAELHRKCGTFQCCCCFVGWEGRISGCCPVCGCLCV